MTGGNQAALPPGPVFVGHPATTINLLPSSWRCIQTLLTTLNSAVPSPSIEIEALSPAFSNLGDTSLGIVSSHCQFQPGRKGL